MIVYLGLFLIFALIGLSVPDRQARPVLIALMLFLLWFMGARYEVGCDYDGYLNRFTYILNWNGFWESVRSSEIGFSLLTAAIKVSGLGYVWLNVASTAIILTCFYVFLRHHRHPLTILALLFPIEIVQLGMSGLRQAIAAGFLMVASVAFQKGSRAWTAFWILVGMQFHMTVILFIPIAFLAGRRVSVTRLVAAVLVIGPIAAILLSERFEVYSNRYVDQIYGEVSSGGAVFRYVLILIPAVFFLAYRRKVKEAYPQVHDLLFLFTLIAFSLAPLAVLSSIALHRLNYYVMPFSILNFVYLSTVIFPRAQLRVGRALPILLYGVYMLVWFTASRYPEACYIPYRNFTLL